MRKTLSRIIVLLLVVCLAMGDIAPAMAIDDGAGTTSEPTATTETGTTSEPTPSAETGTTSEPTSSAETGTTSEPTPSAETGTTSEPTPTTEPTPSASAGSATKPEPSEEETDAVEVTFTAATYAAAPKTEENCSITSTPKNFFASSTAMISGGKLYLTLSLNPGADGTFPYSYLYLGDKTALDETLEKGGELQVVGGVESNGKQTFHFVVDKGEIGTKKDASIVVYALAENGSYTAVTLKFPRNMPVNNAVTEITYPSSPVEEEPVKGVLVSQSKGEAASSYSMFDVKQATAVKLNGIYYVTLYVVQKNYTYLGIGSKTVLDNGGEISAAKATDTKTLEDGTETQVFHISVPAGSVDAAGDVEICVIKSACTTTNSWNTKSLYLTGLNNVPEGNPDPVADPVAYPAAPIPEQDVTGEMYVAKASDETSASYSMFTVTKATAVKHEDTIYATITVKSANYAYLYFGDRTALGKALGKPGKFPVVEGSLDTAAKTATFHFTLPASAAGTRIPICTVKENFKYNSNELVLLVPAKIPEGKSPSVPTAVSYPDAPVSEQKADGLRVVKAGGDDTASLFSLQSATALLSDGTLYVTLTVTPDAEGSYPYPYLYLGGADALNEALDQGGEYAVAAGADGVYHFTLPGSSVGKRFALCAVKSDNTYEPLELVIPDGISEYNAVAAPAIPKLPDDLSEANIKVVKADGSEFKMFAAAKTGLVIGKDKLKVHFETANTSYDRLYFGSKNDAFKSPYIQGTPRADGGWVFEFELPVEYRGAKKPVCLGKPDGTWYEKAELWLSIPGDTGDVSEEIADAGIKMLAGGSRVEQSFVISSSSAERVGSSIICTITGASWNKGLTADKLYFGDRSDKDKSSYVSGTVNADGTTTFVYTVNAERQGSYVPAVTGFSNGTWDNTQSYFLNVPNYDGTFDASAFADGVYDLFGYAYVTKGGVTAVDAGGTLTVSGDTVTIKFVTRTSSYDKIYFGSVSDDEAVRDANAVDAGILNPDDPYSYRYFTVTMPKSALTENLPFVVRSAKNGTWSTAQGILRIARYLPRVNDPADPADPSDPSNPGADMKDGDTYYTTAETGAAMFKVVRAVVTARNGKYDVTLTLNGTSYDYLYPGTGTEADAAGKSAWSPAKVVSGTINGETRDNWHTYTVTVDKLTNPLAVTSHSQKNNIWYDRSITLDLENLKRTAADGSYTATAECSAAMFKIVKTELSVVNGTMTAKLTLSGTGYDYLYPGTAAEAEKDKAGWAAFQLDADGKYTYTIPVSELDKPIAIASHSQKNDKWYDRTVTFLSKSLVKTGDTPTPTDPTPTPTPTPTPAPVDPTKPDEESKYESDTSGSTSRVDNSTTLKDGVYKPDSFSFSGGSGRASIVCDKVTVKNGQAFATIRFVSTSGSPTAYAYVKASGNKYFPDGSSFTIPVELNKNNRILGMTTKMSAAHEIEYTIFVQLKTTDAAQKDTDNEKKDALSTEAPEIMGLTFKEEIQLDHAQYLKLFRYEDGIVLAEIDLLSDTVLDTDKARAEIEAADKAAAADTAEETAAEEESSGSTAQIKADLVSELYKKNVLRYLFVPESAELPAGLEKEYIIVTLPAENVYLMDETPAETLDMFEALSLVKVFGAESAENETLKAGLADESVAFGGSWDKPEYKQLVLAEIDLVLTSGKLLPLSEEALKEREESAPADAETLTAVEYRDRLYDLADRFAVLDVPMLVDRASDEADALAQADWLYLYGILLGDETTAERMVHEIASQEG